MNEAFVDGDFVPVMTYDFLGFQAVAPAEATFALDDPWTHGTCNRHVTRTAASERPRETAKRARSTP